MGHKKGKRKREKERREMMRREIDIVSKGLGLEDNEDDIPSAEEWLRDGIVFGTCHFCGAELVKSANGFGCPNGCYGVEFREA